MTESHDRLLESAGPALTALSLCFTDAKGKPRPHRGIVKCPKCSGDLHYLAKTSALGTIWGKCSTEGCLTWMV